VPTSNKGNFVGHMRRPYRVGDAFCVPLPGGASAHGVVVALGVRSATLAFGDLVLRVGDEALTLHRWPVIGRAAESSASAIAPSQSSRIEAPEIVQDRLAARAGGRPWTRAQLAVRDVRAPLVAQSLLDAPADARLQWRDPLGAEDLRALETCFERNPHASLQPYGAAREHAPSRVLLRASIARHRVLETVDATRDADLVREVALQRLVVRGRSAHAFDARALHAYPSLVSLHVSGVRLENPSAIAELPNLRRLSLRNVRGLRDLAWLERTALEALSLDGVLGVDDVSPLERLATLRQLELRGAWQLSLADVAWLRQAPHLDGLTLDIGGRRKNLEIFKARPRPYARP
jgi:hypothetical protein